MTYDLLNVFKKFFEEDKVILDSYELTDGYYYVIDNYGNFEKMQVVKNNSDNYELEKYIKVPAPAAPAHSKAQTARGPHHNGCAGGPGPPRCRRRARPARRPTSLLRSVL